MKVNPPIAALSKLGLPKQLLDLLNQLWLRTGGGDDVIAYTELVATAEDSRKFVELRNLTKRCNDIELRLEQLESGLTRLKRIEDKLKELELTCQ